VVGVFPLPALADLPDWRPDQRTERADVVFQEGAMSNEADRRGEGSEQSTGSKEYQDQLARLLSEVARTIQRERGGLDETLEAILRTAVETAPRATCASITEVRRRQELSVRLSTDDLARRCDVLQYEVGEGPCLDAAYEHRTVRIEDLWDDNRWPGSRIAPRIYQPAACCRCSCTSTATTWVL